MIQGLLMAFGAAAAPATITYVSNGIDTGNAASYTFTAQAIGTASADRFVIVSVTALSSTNFGNITGVTIDGNAMTELLQIEDASGHGDFAIYGRTVAAGTTADIVVSLSGSPDKCGIDVHRANALQSTTPTDTGTDNTASANLTATVTVQSGGVVLGFKANSNNGTTHTWTVLTERQDTLFGGTGSSMTSASTAYASGQNVTPVVTDSASQAKQALLLLAFR